MKRSVNFIAGIVIAGGFVAANGESLLQPMSFPTVFNDLSFTERMEVLGNGYLPYESIYDADGRCIANCAYPGITLEKALKDIEKAEQESQRILAENQTANNNNTNCTQGASCQETQTQNNTEQESATQNNATNTQNNVAVNTTRNCTDFMESVPVSQNIPIGEPFPKLYRIASGFNPSRLDPVDRKTIRAHNGTDIAAPMGTKIYTVANGTAIRVWTDNSCGNGIIIQHDDNKYRTGYCHLSKHLIKQGDRVSAGCVIGLVGSTGHSTGPHLHYIVYVLSDGKYVPVNAENGYIKPKSERH